MVILQKILAAIGIDNKKQIHILTSEEVEALCIRFQHDQDASDELELCNY